MQRLPYPQSRQERRQSVANLARRRSFASAEGPEEGMEEGSNRDSQNQVSGSASGLITPMSNERSGVGLNDVQQVNKGNEKRQSAVGSLLRNFAASKSKKEAQEESDSSEDNNKQQDEFESL